MIFSSLLFSSIRSFQFLSPKGIEVKFKAQHYPVIISPTAVPELNAMKIEEAGVTLGAAITLTDMTDTLKRVIDTKPGQTWQT